MEKLDNNEHERPVELLDTQQRLKTICDRIHELKPKDYPLTLYRIGLPVDPQAVEAVLKEQSLNELLLKDGEPFSIEDTSGYYPDLEMKAGEVQPVAVSVQAWIWEFGGKRRKKENWSCELNLELWYQKDKIQASQNISISTSSTGAHQPGLWRSLTSPEYAETGYEGHGFKSPETQTVEQVYDFLNVIEPLVDEELTRRASGS